MIGAPWPECMIEGASARSFAQDFMKSVKSPSGGDTSELAPAHNQIAAKERPPPSETHVIAHVPRSVPRGDRLIASRYFSAVLQQNIWRKTRIDTFAAALHARRKAGLHRVAAPCITWSKGVDRGTSGP